MFKKILLGLLGVIVLAVAAGAAFAWMKIRAFDESVGKVYNVPLPAVQRSTDPAVLERGKHLAESLGACLSCHGANLGGGTTQEMGPVLRVMMSNITTGKNGLGAVYSDAEMARLIKHGIRRDGTTVRFMPSHDMSWWPDEDVAAVVSYVRTFPPVDSEAAQTEVRPLGKILDQLGMLPIDIARRIDHENMPQAPAPSPTREYGAYIGKLCTGCHGDQLSGGPIPGAPPELPIPSNLTPHETGLKGWTYADFEKLMREGIRKNGKKLDPFMPIDTTRNFNEVEMKAVWAYLQSLPPVAFGNR